MRRALDQGIPLLAAGEIYARRIAKVAEGDGTRLIAHAYTRYLGDLSGGQILQRLLARSLDLQPSELSFYDFARFSDLDTLKADYRQALDSAGALTADPQAVIEEGAIAFSLNIDLSCAVKAMLSSGRSRQSQRNRRLQQLAVIYPACSHQMSATHARSNAPAPPRYAASNCGRSPASRQYGWFPRRR